MPRRDYIPQITRSMIEDRVHRMFPGTDPATVLAVLDRYGVEPYEQERERVQMSILKLSEGKWEQLEQCVDVAKRDFRDVLAGAEYPNAMAIGFPDTDEMTPAERRRLIEADEKQYKDCLNAPPAGESD